MIRTDRFAAKVGAATLLGAGLALTLIFGLVLAGCQTPPPSNGPDAATSASPKKVEKGPAVDSEQAEVPVVSKETASEEAEVTTAQSVPEKTEKVQPEPVAVQPIADVGTAPVKSPQDPVVEETVKEEPVKTAVVSDPPKETPKETPVRTPVRTPQRTETSTSPAKVIRQAQETVPEPSLDAKIYVVNSTYDFGEVTPLETPTGTFQIKNIGTEVLYLTKIKVCCGAKHTLSSDELEPGDTSVLKLTYRANTVGAFEKYLNVYSNDANNPDVKLTIKGKVVRKLTWTPDRFKLLLDRENAGCVPVKISSVDGKPFALTIFTATENCLVADIDPNKVAKEFTIYPKVDIDKLKGLKIPKGVVRIAHTHPGCDVIKLNYDLVKRFAYAPKRFLVLNADYRRTRTQRLSILDNYTDSQSLKANGEESMLKIESVTCEKDSAVLKSTKQIKDGYQLTFEITPPDPEGKRLFQDLLTIKLSTGDELQVPVNGIYSPAALSASQKK